MDPSTDRNQRSASRQRSLSRPTTPLRSASRNSIRSADYSNSYNAAGLPQPAIKVLEPQFAELTDSITDLEANFMHLQLMHESLSTFNDCFASFLYGLNMNAFCVNFPEGPIPLSFKRAKEAAEREQQLQSAQDQAESTILTTDTTFVDNPQPTPAPASKKPAMTSRYRIPMSSSRGRGRAIPTMLRRNASGTRNVSGPHPHLRARGSGIARPRVRSAR